MFRLLNRILFYLLCAIVVYSCDFVDLRPVELSVEPGVSGSLLAEHYSPVILHFNTEMEKNDAEGLLQISSDLGVTAGDRSWRGNDLYFIPIAGWTAGIKYTLTLLGTIRAVDGRELKIEKFVSFYAINKNAPPLLERFSPGDGESIRTSDVVLTYHFSYSMDRLSVESGLLVEGIGNKTFEWLADDKILNVIPEKQLTAWTSYRWSLKESAKSREGVPLPKTYSGNFTTNLDQTLPFVKKVFPVMNSGGLWFPTGMDIETGLKPENGIAVEFNKDMGESALRSIRFEPSQTGRIEFLSGNSIVYIFSRALEPQIKYTLIISADTKDSEGLKMGEEYRISFVPDVPYLEVLSFIANNGDAEINNFSASGSALTIRVDPADGSANFSIRFSLPFEHEEKQNTALKISLYPFFPGDLMPVALQNVIWVSGDLLYMTWEGMEASSNNKTNFYKLLIPGGKGGIKNEDGIYMKEDCCIYLEAK